MLRVCMAQINTTVGDLEGNTRCICEAIDRSRDLGTDLICFPELSIPGYPPEDLLLKPDFVRGNLAALEEVTRRHPGSPRIRQELRAQERKPRRFRRPLVRVRCVLGVRYVLIGRPQQPVRLRLVGLARTGREALEERDRLLALPLTEVGLGEEDRGLLGRARACIVLHDL